MRLGRWPLTLLVCTLACADGRPAPTTLRLWHTFGPEETDALNQALRQVESAGDARVVATVLPFGRAQNRLRGLAARAETEACPDLARIDATWLPELASARLLRPVDDAGILDGITPEAAELGAWSGRSWGIPQAVDGLALIANAERLADVAVAWPPADLQALEHMARALTTGGRYGLSVRGDGYWFLAYLRASGGDVLTIDRPEAAAALARYAALAGAGGVAPPPEPAGDEAALEARRFRAGEVAILVGGPWTLAGLAGGPRLAIAPYPATPDGRAAAPRGGHLYVVPACAEHPDRAWKLAVQLTAPALQADWSRRLGLVPTRTRALAEASPVARDFAAALAHARPLPRDPLTPELFDDLTPAVQAVLAGDATADEALAGVQRAWQRLRDERGTERP